MKNKVIKAMDKPKIEVGRGAHKLDDWLDRQQGIKRQADEDHKAANPDRYFVAFIVLTLPRVSSNAWPDQVSDTLLFEQPDMPAMDYVINTAKEAWPIANTIDINNFYELSANDFQSFLGDESEWTVIDE